MHIGTSSLTCKVLTRVFSVSLNDHCNILNSKLKRADIFLTNW